MYSFQQGRNDIVLQFYAEKTKHFAQVFLSANEWSIFPSQCKIISI